jgi:hypothetical protein
MLIGIINFPWVIKLIFGLIFDNVSLCGSRRRSYLLLACICNLASLVALILFAMKHGKIFLTVCLFLTQICMTTCDAITDALIVQASRVDSDNAAANLNTLT